ncbi:MAG: hypothetical protein Q3965_00945 [Rothia sp. (in: high G+C Gram-positive bacteria)]|nr:hypothetical protein [Rothia sp. (in: high G+C Gram-positive bacteria)]
MKNQHISRRSVAQGAAWAVPAVVATAAVPAYAASKIPPTLVSSTSQARADRRGDALPHYNCNGATQAEIYNTRPSSYITVNNLPANAKLSNLTMEFWLAVDANTTWTIPTTATTGTSADTSTVKPSTCWTVPVRSYKDVVRNGITFYSFKSTFTCPITVTGSTWTLPTNQKFAFLSSCQSVSRLRSGEVHYEQTITVNGSTVLTKSSPWGTMVFQ